MFPASADTVVAELAGLVERLAGLPAAAGDAERIDRIAALERLRGAVAAAQARETVDFARSQIAAQAAAGVPASRRGRGVAEQIGFARRISPAWAARQLGLAQAWQTDLPAVYRLLRRGEISEWSAQIVAKQTRELPADVRRAIAAELAPDLPGLSPREMEVAARRLAYQADPHAVLARARTARADRGVSIRPAPDTMAVVSAFLPAEQGIAAWASLDRHARGLRATGDPRTRGQIMADTLVERLTGQSSAAVVPVEIGLTMTADSLLSAGTGSADLTPADLRGYGPIPAELALDLAATAQQEAAAWVRRLVTDPVDDTVARIDTKRRRFDGALAELIRHRDRLCRDPYCTAPIRHLDHVEPYRDGGPTTAANGAGLCERGNYVKDMPGWTRRVVIGPGAPAIEITTPTGHSYTSKAPPALGPGGRRGRRRPLKRPSGNTCPQPHRRN